ncbi:serine hydrolase [bacterium]|nr:MAG: serine hydrolase [bacterium]
MSRSKVLLVTLAGVAAALLAGFAAGKSVAPRGEISPARNVYEIRLSSAGLTGPLLECEESAKGEAKPEIRYFNTELRAKVAEIEAREGVKRVAVYFRDLENGLSIGVNQDEKFIPASLSKVPLLITCLKMAELDPKFFDRKVKFPGLPAAWMRECHYPPAKTLETGKEYTVAELLDYTISYSDNAATWLLYNTVTSTMVDNVLYDFGFNCDIYQCRMSPEAYGRFFRILYNASYLSDEMSEKALTLLAKCQFDKGIVAGLPKGVTVAHKFGEMYKQTEAGKPLQLHDCGIVYAKGNPYVLCVMTAGDRHYKELETAIQEISRFVYDKVSEKVALSASETDSFRIANADSIPARKNLSE